MPEGYSVEEAKKAVDDLASGVATLQKTVDSRDEEVKRLGTESGETKQMIEKIQDAVDKFDEAKERLDKIEVAVKRGLSTESKDSDGNVVTEEVQAYKAAVIDYMRKGIEAPNLGELEEKALAVQSDPDGGYHVTPDTNGRVVKRIFETSPIRALAAVQTIGTDALEGLVQDDEAGAEWVGETDTPTDEKTPKIGKWKIPIHEMATRPKATQKLLDDSNVDIESWLMQEVADKFGRFEANAFVLGNGNAKPRGFLTYDDYLAAEKGKDGWARGRVERTDSAGAAVDFDDLMDLQTSLKAAYMVNARWAWNRYTLRDIRKIKDNDGRYIWEVSTQVGNPHSVLGTQYSIFEDMPDVATGTLPVAYADWARFYQIVDRAGMRILRDPFSFKPFVEFYTTRRVGGDVLNFDAGKLLEMSA